MGPLIQIPGSNARLPVTDIYMGQINFCLFPFKVKKDTQYPVPFKCVTHVTTEPSGQSTRWTYCLDIFDKEGHNTHNPEDEPWNI